MPVIGLIFLAVKGEMGMNPMKTNKRGDGVYILVRSNLNSDLIILKFWMCLRSDGCESELKRKHLMSLLLITPDNSFADSNITFL